MIPQKVWPHLGVPTESIKARGVRLRWLYVRGSFDDPCSAKKIHHLAEDVSLARNGVPGGLSSEDLIFLARCARFLRYVHPVWQV